MLNRDLSLARRLEAAEAANARGCNASQPGGGVLEIGGGLAVFAGAESPLTHAVALGLDGPVPAADIDRLEAFFRSRGARPTIDLCPLADPGLVETLAERGYRLTEFNNVLVRTLPAQAMPPAPRVKRAQPHEGDLWSHTVGAAFFERPQLTEDEMEIGRAIFAMPGAMCYLAQTATGEAAGGAAMAVHGGLATLFADGVIAAFRRQGLHRELVAARLEEAAAQGCDLATASTLPGSASQRNYERLGFEVVYTKVTLIA